MAEKNWLQTWQTQNIAFHQGVINQKLIQYADKLELNPNDQVFVPLCGKSSDLRWLAEQGYSVLGNELSPIAANDFFAENNLAFEKTQLDSFMQYNNEKITLLQGDYFQLQKQHLASVKAVYDRAALVALPEEMRSAYIDLQIRLLPESVKILLINIEYTAEELSPPPFSVTEEEIVAKYGVRFNVTKLEEFNAARTSAHLIERHLNPQGNLKLIAKVFLLTDSF